MNYLVGKWNLVEKSNFDGFLKYTQIPWYQRKIAKYCGVTTTISKNNDETYTKSVKSRFYKMDPEIIDFDKSEYIKSGTTKKKYSREDDVILADVLGSIVNWKERIYYQEPYLIVEYNWGKDGFAQQKFKKV
tara:strand:+ start:480 stop:875 length:396 start_codon:yes stop_codon:yes gene_type:complete